MNAVKPILLLIVPCFVAACASVRTFEMPKVEENLTQALQAVDALNGKLQGDFAQKRNLLESLGQNPQASFKDIEPDLRTRLTNMKNALARHTSLIKSMAVAQSQIAALASTRAKIHAFDPEFPQVEKTVTQFEDAAKQSAAAASEYSRDSDVISEFVAVKKLYFNFDMSDFNKKVNRSLGSARENQSIMRREMERADKIRKSFRRDQKRRMPVEQALNQMNTIHESHKQKINALTELAKRMNVLAEGRTKIASTTPNWGEVQRLVAESEQISLSLNDLYRDFQLKVERVRNPPKVRP